jgi:hypothetical protein
VPKTSRTNATTTANELAIKLNVDKRLVLQHSRRLALRPHHGFNNQVFFTEGQCLRIAEAIKQSPRVQVYNGVSAIGAPKAQILAKALAEGASAEQLVIKCGASFEEADLAWGWWHRKRLVLNGEELQVLQEKVGRFSNGQELITLLVEVVHNAQTCRRCGAWVQAPLCQGCTPVRAPEPKPGVEPEINGEFEKRMRDIENSFALPKDSTDPTGPNE